jgi:hypothetical protein
MELSVYVKPHLTEPKDLLSCSQEPSTGPYTNTDQSSIPSGLFLSDSPTNIYVFLFSPIRATCLDSLIFLDLIILISTWL